MKIINLIVLQIISIIALNITAIWCVIEFIVYLVKDREFNWWSLISLVINIAIAMIIAVGSVMRKAKSITKKTANSNGIRSHVIKSKFQQKLEKLQKEQKERYTNE